MFFSDLPFWAFQMDFRLQIWKSQQLNLLFTKESLGSGVWDYRLEGAAAENRPLNMKCD